MPASSQGKICDRAQINAFAALTGWMPRFFCWTGLLARHGHRRGGGVGAVPPAAAKSLEQSRRIGEAHHLRLYQRELGCLVHLLGTQH